MPRYIEEVAPAEVFIGQAHAVAEAHTETIRLFQELSDALRGREAAYAAIGRPYPAHCWLSYVNNLNAVTNTLSTLGQLVQTFPDEPRLLKGAEDFRARAAANRERIIAEDTARELQEAESAEALRLKLQKVCDDAQARRDAM